MADSLPPVIAIFEGDASDLDETIDSIEQRLADLDGSTALGRVTFILTAKSVVTVRYEESDGNCSPFSRA